MSALDRIINSGFLDRAWDAADIEAAQTELSTLRARVGELEGFDEAHGRALNEIVMIAHWAKQYHNGAHDCDCGWCRARNFLENDGRAALTNPRCPPAEKETEK